jgi:hypothetical protein
MLVVTRYLLLQCRGIAKNSRLQRTSSLVRVGCPAFPIAIVTVSRMRET